MPDVNPYGSLLDEENDHLRAQANTAGAYGVPTAAAASALNDASASRVPPVVGMHAPEEGAQLAAQRREQAILARSAPVRALAAKSPAHVAATRDDWGLLANLGDLMAYDFRETRAAAGAVAREFNRPAEDMRAGRIVNPFDVRMFSRLLALGEAAAGNVTGLSPLSRLGERGIEGIVDLQGPGFTPPTVDFRTDRVIPGRAKTREEAIADWHNFFGMAMMSIMPGRGGGAAAGAAEAGAARTVGGRPHVGPDGPTFTPEGAVADAEGLAASFPTSRDAAMFLRTHSASVNVGEFSVFNNANEGVYHVVRNTPRAPVGVDPADTPIYQAQAEADAAVVAKMEDAVASTATHTRTPQVMEEFLQGTPAGATSVWVDPKAIAAAYAEGHSPFPGMTAQVMDALATGRDVEVPMSTYLTEVSGQPYAEALRKATRFTSEGVSVEEGKGLPKVEEGAVTPPATDLAPPPTALPAHVESAVDTVFAELTLSKLTDAKALGLTQAQFERYNLGVENARAAIRDRTLAKIEKAARAEDITPEEVVALVREAMVGPEVEGLLTDQLREFAEANGLPLDKEALQLAAKESMDRLPVKQAANVREAERAFKRTSRGVEDALLKSNVVRAFAEKQRQVLAWYQLEQAHRLTRQLARANRDFTRLARKKVSKGLAQPFLDQLHGYLPGYGFPTKRNPVELAEALADVDLNTFVDAVVASNPTFPEVPDIAPQPMGDMTTADFRVFSEFVYAMRRYGREVRTLQAQGVTEQRQALVDELIAGAPVKPPPVNRPPTMSPRLTRWNKAMALKRGYDAIHRKVYDLLAYFDNGRSGGVMERTVEFPLEESSDKESRLERETYAPVVDAFNAIPGARRATYATGVIPEHPFTLPDGSVPTITPGDAVGMALYVGEESALQKLADGLGTTAPDVLDFLDANLTKAEREFVQAVWNGFGRLAPEVSKELRADTGTGLERLPLRPWVTPDGTFTGGYIPLRYAAKWDVAAASRELERAAQVGLDPVGQFFGDVVPSKGFAEERTGYAAPLDVSLSRISTIFDTHIKYAAWSRNLKSVRRFLNDPTTRALVEQRMGPEYWEQINPWLDSLVVHVSPSDPAMKWIDAWANELRTNYSVSVLGLSFTTGIAQVAGLPNAMAVVGDGPVDGVRRIAQAMAQFYWMEVNGGKGSDLIFEKSEMMRKRAGGRQDANLADALDRLRRNPFDPKSTPARLFDRAKEFALAYIGFVEFYTVSAPTWLAGYTKAIEGGGTETQAVRAGNRAVEQSQGSGRKEQLAAIQRHKGLVSLIYAFETPFNAQYQRLFDTARAAGRGDHAKAANLFLLTFVVGPLLAAMLTRHGPKDANPATIALWALENFALNITRPLLGVGAVANTLGFNFEAQDGKFVPQFHNAGDVDFSASVATRGASDLFVSLNAAWKLAEGKRVERPVAKVLRGAELTGVPGVSQLARTGEYAFELSTGEQRLSGDAVNQALQFLTGASYGPQADQANHALIQRLRAQSRKRSNSRSIR